MPGQAGMGGALIDDGLSLAAWANALDFAYYMQLDYGAEGCRFSCWAPSPIRTCSDRNTAR